jgi:hypothetical protein
MGASNILRLLTAAQKDGVRYPMASGDVLQFLPETDDTGSVAFGNGTYDWDVVWYGGSSTVKVLFDVGNARVQLAGVDISSNDAIVTTGAVNAATFKSTGDANLASITCVGAVNTASVAATGACNAANATFTNFVNTATFTATTNTNTAGMNITGNANLTGYVVPTTNGAVFQKTIIANANCTLNAAHWGALVINQNTVVNGAWFEFIQAVSQNTTFTGATANTIVAPNTLLANSVILNTTNELIGATVKFVCDGSLWYCIPSNFGAIATVD